MAGDAVAPKPGDCSPQGFCIEWTPVALVLWEARPDMPTGPSHAERDDLDAVKLKRLHHRFSGDLPRCARQLNPIALHERYRASILLLMLPFRRWVLVIAFA